MKAVTLKASLVSFVALILLAGAACATLHRADGSLNVPQILNDGRWGVMAACDAEYLQPADCTLATDTLTLADGIAATNVGAVGPAVRQLIVDAESRLAADSRLRPYLDAIVVVLKA